jgi:uncharacterized protein YgiB involved in biofilm formation
MEVIGLTPVILQTQRHMTAKLYVSVNKCLKSCAQKLVCALGFNEAKICICF